MSHILRWCTRPRNERRTGWWVFAGFWTVSWLKPVHLILILTLGQLGYQTDREQSQKPGEIEGATNLLNTSLCSAPPSKVCLLTPLRRSG